MTLFNSILTMYQRRLESLNTWRERTVGQGVLIAVADGQILVIAPSAWIVLELFTQLIRCVDRQGYALVMWVAGQSTCHTYLR